MEPQPAISARYSTQSEVFDMKLFCRPHIERMGAFAFPFALGNQSLVAGGSPSGRVFDQRPTPND
jgi:hypothetical protein